MEKTGLEYSRQSKSQMKGPEERLSFISARKNKSLWSYIYLRWVFLIQQDISSSYGICRVLYFTVDVGIFLYIMDILIYICVC